MIHTIEEYRNLLSNISGEPWKIEQSNKLQLTGDNWLIADFGINTETGEAICVTTDGVNTSRLADDPEADAFFLVTMRNEIGGILKQWEEAEAKVTKIQRILSEPAPFGAVEEQLDQIKEIVEQPKEEK